MNLDEAIQEFEKEIKSKYAKDMIQIQQRLGAFIDHQVIGRKFDKGFKGHKLTPRTIKRKGHDKVGVQSGELRKKAVAFTSWQLFGPTGGKRERLMTKDQHGLTPYSDVIRTSIGGKIDVMKLEPEDISNISTELRRIFASLGYEPSGTLQVIQD